MIGEPAVVVGHSLGAIVAASLAQDRHPLVAAVFLEDPPLYVVEPDVFAGSSLARGFAVLRDHIRTAASRGAPIETYRDLLAASPHPGGGRLGDHLHDDALWSRAGALAQTDLDAITAVLDGTTFAAWDPDRPLHRPTLVLRADPAYDAAFQPDHEHRLHRTSPTPTWSPCPEPATTSAVTEPPGTATSTSSPTSSPTSPPRPWSSNHDHHPSITEHTLTLASGHRLRYATRRADLPISVVFVHGWPDSWRSFQPVLDALPPTIGAISVSLRGFGGSDAPADGYTPDDFAADVRELVDHLGVTSAVFVGHSMGTLVVQRLAASHPEVVAGLVLIGGLRAPRRRVRRGVVRRAGPRRSDQRAVRPRVPVEHPRRTRPGRLLRPARRREPPGPARVWRAAFAGIRTMPRRRSDQRPDAAAVG